MNHYIIFSQIGENQPEPITLMPHVTQGNADWECKYLTERAYCIDPNRPEPIRYFATIMHQTSDGFIGKHTPLAPQSNSKSE